MSYDKFDFDAATRLVNLIESSASMIDVKNGQIEKKFGELREFFKDEGYIQYESEMNVANRGINEIISQLHVIGRHIEDYKQRLQNEV